MSGLTREQADELAEALALDFDELEICYACLSFVAVPLELGRLEEAARESRRIAPDLWDEGLALPLRAALEEARRRGVPRADEASGDVARRGPRARIVPAVIRRLAADLVARTRANAIGGKNGHVTILP